MSVADAVRGELAGLGLLSGAEGQAALALAVQIDRGKSALAAPGLVKELRATLAALRASVPVQGDAVDGLRAKVELHLAG